MKHTFYFNTGVQPSNVRNPEFDYEYHREKGHVIKNGTLHIPFDCDAPEDCTLLFMCNDPSLPESKQKNVIVCKVSNTTMFSKYAYLKMKGER